MCKLCSEKREKNNYIYVDNFKEICGCLKAY